MSEGVKLTQSQVEAYENGATLIMFPISMTQVKMSQYGDSRVKEGKEMTREEAEEQVIPIELECEECGTMCSVYDTECEECGAYVDFNYYREQIEELIQEWN